MWSNTNCFFAWCWWVTKACSCGLRKAHEHLRSSLWVIIHDSLQQPVMRGLYSFARWCACPCRPWATQILLQRKRAMNQRSKIVWTDTGLGNQLCFEKKLRFLAWSLAIYKHFYMKKNINRAWWWTSSPPGAFYFLLGVSLLSPD